MALNMTPNLIPYPPIEQRILDVDSYRKQSPDCRGYDHLQPPRPKIADFLVIHKQQSPPDSTLAPGYFEQACCPALTDYEINSVTGHMKQFVTHDGVNDIAGWANGVLNAPYGDALKYIEWRKTQPGGWWSNLANIKGKAWEFSGYFPTWPVTQDTPVDEVAIANFVQYMAAEAHNYGIQWDTFPIIPAENNRSYITWHQEWTIGTGKICPGPWVMNQTSAWIERAAQIMRAYQEVDPGGEVVVPKPIEYTPSVLPTWWIDQAVEAKPSDQRHKGATAYVLQRNFKCLATTKRRSEPLGDAPLSGPDVAADTRITAERLWKDPVEGKSWLIEDTGHYVLASKFSPRVTIEPRS